MPKVLLVDDEPNIRWTMAEFLKREGYDALTASDFESALECFNQNRIDAAVIDIILPRRSGIELLKELRTRSPRL
ncbi:MAG: response regulator, partial [Acidobacteria bacterium]|nr:response regulator [Acidobacteriota bacterium]